MKRESLFARAVNVLPDGSVRIVYQAKAREVTLTRGVYLKEYKQTPKWITDIT